MQLTAAVSPLPLDVIWSHQVFFSYVDMFFSYVLMTLTAKGIQYVLQKHFEGQREPKLITFFYLT